MEKQKETTIVYWDYIGLYRDMFPLINPIFYLLKGTISLCNMLRDPSVSQQRQVQLIEKVSLKPNIYPIIHFLFHYPWITRISFRNAGQKT